MKYCCYGNRPLTGMDDSNRMKKECLQRKLVEMADGDWGSKNFSRFAFDNGYVVEISENGQDTIYNNQEKMSFDLFLITRSDGYKVYCICEENAHKFFELEQYKIKHHYYDSYDEVFNTSPKKVHFNITCYELKDLIILDGDYRNAYGIKWVDYVHDLQAHPNHSYLDYDNLN